MVCSAAPIVPSPPHTHNPVVPDTVLSSPLVTRVTSQPPRHYYLLSSIMSLSSCIIRGVTLVVLFAAWNRASSPSRLCSVCARSTVAARMLVVPPCTAPELDDELSSDQSNGRTCVFTNLGLSWCT